jgi:hypothetical protein
MEDATKEEQSQIIGKLAFDIFNSQYDN